MRTSRSSQSSLARLAGSPSVCGSPSINT